MRLLVQCSNVTDARNSQRFAELEIYYVVHKSSSLLSVLNQINTIDT